MLLGLSDTQDPARNLATKLTWTIWWAGIIPQFAIGGRCDGQGAERVHEVQPDVPEVATLYEWLGESAAAGPLDQRTVHLVKLGMAIGARYEGAVHSHARRALAAGATAAQVRHVAALAVPTLGFPGAVAAFTWIEDVLHR